MISDSDTRHLRISADFPFDRIKIDRSFVDGMINNNNCASIVRATVDLARNLKMLTTAERY